MYDRHVAATYDRDVFGLLAGGRELALSQLTDLWPSSQAPLVVDLGVGTGDGLLGVWRQAPQARLTGIDVSAQMLAEAESKVPAAVLVPDDARRVAAHVGAGRADLVLVHYLTTYVDVGDLLARVVEVLRPGGLLSLVSTTYEAFPVLAAAAAELVGEEGLRRLNPAPESAEVLRSALAVAGLEVLRDDMFEAQVSFDSLAELVRWGRQSGFLTHVLDGLPGAATARLPQLEPRFPVVDRYRAVVLLARKPAWA